MLMLFAALGLVAIFVFLVVAEYMWRQKIIHGEIGRKLIHIVVGSFVAFWPFFTDIAYVKLLAVMFLVVILLSKQFQLFRSIHAVKRRTVGEILFPIAILGAAIFAKSDWIFAATILHLSLADGLAAVMGTVYGKKNSYKVFEQTKSVVGSGTFLVVSLLIFGVVILFGLPGMQPEAWKYALTVPIIAMIAENVSRNGTDNIVVPAIVLLALNNLA